MKDGVWFLIVVLDIAIVLRVSEFQSKYLKHYINGSADQILQGLSSWYHPYSKHFLAQDGEKMSKQLGAILVTSIPSPKM